MNSTQCERRSGAFTLIELLCVIGIIGILAALLMPALGRGKTGAQRVQCVGNLKQLGIGFLSFAHDHKDRFPMQTPSAEGGTLEFVQGGYQVSGPFYFSFRHFAALSNELVTPKPLICPTDERRFAAASFSRFGNDHLSYFVGVAAEPQRTASVLAGDRNVTNSTVGSATIVRQPYGSAIRWTAELHRYKGNLLFADGHVEERNDRELASAGSVPLGDFVLPTPSGNAGGNATAPALANSSRIKSEPQHQDAAKPSDDAETRGAVPVYAKELSVASAASAVAVTKTDAPSEVRAVEAPATAAPAIVALAGNGGAVAESESKWKNPFLWLLYLLLLLLLAIIAVAMRRQFRRES